MNTKKPTALLKLSGTIDRKKYKDRIREVKPDGMPEPVMKLPAEAQKFWDRRVPELVKLGLAKSCDSETLTAMAMIWADLVRAWRLTIKNRPDNYHIKHSRLVNDFAKYSSMFGISPKDRAGLIGDAQVEGQKNSTRSYLA